MMIHLMQVNQNDIIPLELIFLISTGMDPNLVLKGSQRLKRFSKSLKWSSSHKESSESPNETPKENSMATPESRDSPSKQLDKEIMNNFPTGEQFKPTKDHNSSNSVTLSSLTHANKQYQSAKYLLCFAEKSRFSSTTYQRKTAINEVDRAFYHNDEKEQTKTLKSEVVTSNKKEKMAIIDEIFETFVPAMRATETSPNFFSRLVSLHNRNDTTKLRTEDLIRHLNALQSSFKKFALTSKMFKTILHTDQVELLDRNSLMFAMVSNT